MPVRYVRSIRVLATLLLVVCSIALAGCNEYQTARGDYARGDYKQALRRLEALAREGHVAAQYDVAQMYFQGIGTAENTVEGARWLLLAADSGNVGAMIQIAGLYEQGVAGVRDDIRAAQWYRRAARHGDAVARFHLGMMSLEGRGVPRDASAALAWLRLSQRAGGWSAKLRADELAERLSPAERDRAETLMQRFSEAQP